MAGKSPQPVAVFVCSKCSGKTYWPHLIGKGRIICPKCRDELRRFTERIDTTTLPSAG